MNTLGSRIKEIRNDNQLTQSLFAESISVSRSFISRVESDKEIPSDSLVKLIASTYKTSYLWLKTGVGEKTIHTDVIQDIRYQFSNDVSLKDIIKSATYYEKFDVSYCLSVLLNIIKNQNIKKNSERYYYSKVLHILFSIDNYLKSHDFFEKNPFSEYPYDKIQDETLNNIKNSLREMMEAFDKEDLNEKWEKEFTDF